LKGLLRRDLSSISARRRDTLLGKCTEERSLLDECTEERSLLEECAEERFSPEGVCGGEILSKALKNGAFVI
jgi:hypothetical protein